MRRKGFEILKQYDLTTGKITAKLWAFALPLMLGNVMQQLYNLADTWVVGKYIGSNALAAVGSSYSLTTFLTSVIIGLCLGTSAFFSIAHGRHDYEKIRNGKFISFTVIGAFSILLSAAVIWQAGGIIRLLRVPDEIFGMMKTYLLCIFCGIFASFLYNYYANLLRGIGNSAAPLVFLSVSVVLNIGLDIIFVVPLEMGIHGAALATVISQYIAGIGICAYTFFKYPKLRITKADAYFNKSVLKNIASLSGFTCLQQSVMNFGILAVQGIVNGFGAAVMSAFAVAVKIDTIAYMPVQDFGNAFSTFIAQNYGAGKPKRIKAGIKQSAICVVIFCAVISAAVVIFAKPLMEIFVSKSEIQIIETGVQYLRIEGTCYIGIGILFMLYGYYRAIDRPAFSVVLTVISLGTRVLLSYLLSKIPQLGETGIWISIPIGWFLADAAGIIHYLAKKRKSPLGRTS